MHYQPNILHCVVVSNSGSVGNPAMIGIALTDELFDITAISVPEIQVTLSQNHRLMSRALFLPLFWSTEKNVRAKLL